MKLWNLKVKQAFNAIGSATVLVAWVLGSIDSAAAGIVPNPIMAGLLFQSMPYHYEIDGSGDPAAAESFLAAAESPLNEQNEALWSGTRAVGSLICVLALILITMRLLKRYMPHRFGPLGHKHRIQVMETVPIGEKRSLTLVEIDGHSLLLASTPSNVSLLKEIPWESNITNAKAQTDAPRLTTATPPVEDGALNIEGLETAVQFKETLAAEIVGDITARLPTPLARISRIRAELEAM